MQDIKLVCKLRAVNPKWGKCKLASCIKMQELRTIPESTVQRHYEAFLYDLEEEELFRKSTELHEIHRRLEPGVYQKLADK